MCKKPSWIELCGLVTAVCAIVVSVYSVYKTIQHDSLEAVPHLSFYSMGPQFIYYPGMRGPFEIGVSNNGSGIAIVQEIKILCNGLEAEEAIRVCAVESGYVVQTNNSVPYYLRSGQKIIFFRANDDAIKAKIEGVPEQKTKNESDVASDLNQIAKNSRKINIKVKYKSIYGDEYEVSGPIGDFPDQAAR